MQSTISDDYRKQQEKLHENPNYGTASVQFAPMVTKIINQAQVEELLDIGAGKCRLFESIKPDHRMRLQAYDPAIPELSGDPTPMQMTTCIDVAEHVEPEMLENFLNFVRDKTLEITFITVHTGPAMKVLPDGRNAHLIQEPAEWWLPKLMQRFNIQMFQRMDNGFIFVGSVT
jgi:hypothetical protein